MTNATQTLQTKPVYDIDRLLEILEGKPTGLDIEDIYRGLSGDTDYQPPDFEPFGDNPPDPKLDETHKLVDEAVKARKIERNTAGRYQLIRRPFVPQKPVEPRKAEVPGPRTPQKVAQPQRQSQADVKPVKPTQPTKSKGTDGNKKGKREPWKPKVPYRKPTSQNEQHKAIEKAFSLPLQQRMYGIAMHTLCYAQPNRDDPLSPSRTITPSYLAQYVGVPDVDRARDAAKALVEAGLFIRVDSQKGGRPSKRPGAPETGAVYRPVVPDFDSK